MHFALNRADYETLLTVPYITEAVAERIIWYRENIAPFQSVQDLQQVPGVTDNLYRQLVPHFYAGL